jgi:hypothetical protein
MPTRETTTYHPDGRSSTKKETLDASGKVIKIEIVEHNPAPQSYLVHVPSTVPSPEPSHQERRSITDVRKEIYNEKGERIKVEVTKHQPIPRYSRIDDDMETSSLLALPRHRFSDLCITNEPPEQHSTVSLPEKLTPSSSEKRDSSTSITDIRTETYDAHGRVIKVKIVKKQPRANNSGEKKKIKKKKKKKKEKRNSDTEEPQTETKPNVNDYEDATRSSLTDVAGPVPNGLSQHGNSQTDTITVTNTRNEESHRQIEASSRRQRQAHYEVQNEDGEFWSEEEEERPGAVSVPGLAGSDDNPTNHFFTDGYSNSSQIVDAEVTFAAEVAPDTDAIIDEMQQRLEELEEHQTPVLAESVEVERDSRNKFLELGYDFYG